jgi:hypothetical protein
MSVTERSLIIPPAIPQGPFEVTGFTKLLLSNATIPAGKETRLWPGLDVSKWDRLHLTIGADARAVANLNVRVLLSTPVPGTHCGGILTSSTIWFENQGVPREFEYTTPANFGETGFTMSVPVVAPVLYDVILRNTGMVTLRTVYVCLFAQEV